MNAIGHSRSRPRLPSRIATELAAFFRSQADTEELREAQRETILSRTVVLVWISTFGMPTTCLPYVYFLKRERFSIALWMVSAAVFADLLLRFFVLRGAFRRSYHLAMFLLVGGIFGPLASGILELTQGSSGDFFFAFYMIFFSFTALYPAEVTWIIGTAAFVIADFVLSRAWRPEGIAWDGPLVSGLIYLFNLAFIGVVLNRVVYRLFFDERRARSDLAAANESLRELDKAKSSFFQNISHEIRTPLTLILTPITLLLQTRGKTLPPDVSQKLVGIKSNAERLLKMVNSLLDFARLEAGQVKIELQPFKVGELLGYTRELFEAAAENKSIRLVIDNRAKDLVVTSDLDKVEKILVNLVGNALKFTPSGGEIRMGLDRAGDFFNLVVADTGIGIAPEDQRRVFQRFTQVENAAQTSVRGTGIGLSMVQEYARLLGGSVSVESELGKGSTFTVSLPTETVTEDGRVVTEPMVTASNRVPSGQLALADLVLSEDHENERVVDRAGEGKPRVLVVDDNPALVGLVAAILEQDYNLYLTYNGQEALDVLASRSVDLVISDVMMPGISGLELCRRMRSSDKLRHVPIVLLTARGGTLQKVEGLDTGADDYIGKPFDPEELKARVRSLFELRRTVKNLADKSSELERAMTKLKEEELKVIESEKLRTLGELAAGMFHELHNYMNIICNGAVPLQESITDLTKGLERQGLRVEDFDSGEVRELIGMVVEAAQAARSVTAELKGYAHQERDGTKAVDLNDVVSSTVRMFSKSERDHIKLALHAEPVVVECFPTRLNQVFTNLLRNALDAMKGQGTVTITTTVEEGKVIARVTDTGPGIPEHVRAKLFEPFFTTKRQGKGLGLGLSLSRKVLHDVGGDLVFEPGDSPGARFVIRLPASAARPRRGASSTAPPPPAE